MKQRELDAMKRQLDAWRSSDPRLTKDNAVDNLVLQFAVTVDEAEAVYDDWIDAV